MLTCWIVRTPTWIVSVSTQVTYWWLKALEKGTKLVSQMHRTLETRILKDLRTNCFKHLLFLYHKPSSTYQSRLVKLWYLFDYRNCRTHILVQSLLWWIPLFRLVKSTSREIRAWNPNQRKSRRLKQENPFNSNFSMNTAVYLSITKNKYCQCSPRFLQPLGNKANSSFWGQVSTKNRNWRARYFPPSRFSSLVRKRTDQIRKDSDLFYFQ
jgi:hypothetical protein